MERSTFWNWFLHSSGVYSISSRKGSFLNEIRHLCQATIPLTGALGDLRGSFFADQNLMGSIISCEICMNSCLLKSWGHHAMETLSAYLTFYKNPSTTECFLCCEPEEAVEQTLALPVIQDAMTLMWRYHNKFRTNSNWRYFEQKVTKVTWNYNAK